MKKHWVIAGIVSLSFWSCYKDEVSPVPSYEIELHAIRPSVGLTVFDTIQYRDASGALETLIADSQNFSRSFAISDTFDVYFKVKGTVTGTSQTPFPSISYAVYRTLEGTRTKQCEEIYSGTQGSSGNYTIQKEIKRKFDKSACQ